MVTKKDNIGKFEMIFDTLEGLVPANHPVRSYDSAIDWKFIYPLVENMNSNVGKPSIDPIIFLRTKVL